MEKRVNMNKIMGINFIDEIVKTHEFPNYRACYLVLNDMHFDSEDFNDVIARQILSIIIRYVGLNYFFTSGLSEQYKNNQYLNYILIGAGLCSVYTKFSLDVANQIVTEYPLNNSCYIDTLTRSS